MAAHVLNSELKSHVKTGPCSGLDVAGPQEAFCLPGSPSTFKDSWVQASGVRGCLAAKPRALAQPSPDGPGEQDGILRDDGQLGPQGLQADAADVHAVDEDPARGRLRQPEERHPQGGLPCRREGRGVCFPRVHGVPDLHPLPAVAHSWSAGRREGRRGLGPPLQARPRSSFLRAEIGSGGGGGAGTLRSQCIKSSRVCVLFHTHSVTVTLKKSRPPFRRAKGPIHKIRTARF